MGKMKIEITDEGTVSAEDGYGKPLDVVELNESEALPKSLTCVKWKTYIINGKPIQVCVKYA
ncbi:MAG: hypothetical protein PVH30_00460 [Desulfobacterales bacterium]|jgi:hypothetical protein